MQNWLDNPTHHTWLDRHATDLLAFGRRSGRTDDPAGGAYWLDDDGHPDRSKPIHAWITTRTVHTFGIGTLLGVPGAADVAAAALRGLTGPDGALHDTANGGWFSAVDPDGSLPAADDPNAIKSCYDHGFVVLAGATATHAGLPGGRELFDEATAVFLDRFWDDEAGACLDEWDLGFTEPAPYRGLNANMHSVEAMLSAASLTDDPTWLDRAARVCRRVIEQGAANDWRLPEHYDQHWNPILDYNHDRPADQFKPYGSTVGHSFEWARLLLHAANAPGPDRGVDLASGPIDRLAFVDAARHLFDRAVADGWAPDGAPGFVYTVDWNGNPVVGDRLWWVLTEAIAAAATLHRVTDDPVYVEHYRRWWDHAATHHIEPTNGSWRPQLDATNQPSDTVWAGKPDLYHSFQAALIPTRPLYPMLAAAVDRGE